MSRGDSQTIRGYDREIQLAAGDVVLINYAGTDAAMAVVTDPRPYPARQVANVKYLHSNTGACVAHRRILSVVSSS